jgi:Carbohydrate binding domain
MGIPLTGSGGLFSRMGALAQLKNDVNVNRGTTIPADVNSINSQYETTDQNLLTNLYQTLSSYQNSSSTFSSYIRSLASSTIIQMVNDISSQANQNLSTALQFLINQMLATGQTVNRCTLSSGVAYSPSNIGNPNVVISLSDFNNLLVEDCFAETATGQVTQDSQTSPSLAGVEQMSFQSQYSVSDTFSWLYPAGSGTSLTLTAVSGMTNNGSGTNNWLNNGSFESWLGGIPSGWTAETGTPGTTIIQSSSPVYDGSFALEFLGNGSENTAIAQQFSTPSGTFATTANVLPNTLFMVNLWCQVSGTPSSGVIRVALTNGTTPINDNSGTPNSFDINLTTLTNTWVPFSGTFRTPNQMPTSVFLEIKMITPITTAFKVYFDRVSFCQPRQMYAGGPFVSVFSGNINMIKGDSFIVTINNAYNGINQFFFDECFNMKSLSLILPSSISPTIPDP